MAITKKDLEKEVKIFNDKYCKNTKHELVVQSAYGGHKVCVTGKARKDGRGYRGRLGSGVDDLTHGFQTPRKTIEDLWAKERANDIKKKVQRLEKPSPWGKKKSKK